MIKAIAFDFGGVIAPGVILKWIKSLPKTDPRYIYFERVSAKWDLGEFSVEQFYEALSKITGQEVGVLKRTFYDKAEYSQEIIDLIKKLKKTYKIIIFTNNFSYNLEKYFEKLGLANLFDHLIISSEHKVIKPNPVFYQKMLETVQLKPEEILFIDDTQDNVDAGNKLGIKSFLYRNSQTLIGNLKSEGIHI